MCQPEVQMRKVGEVSHTLDETAMSNPNPEALDTFLSTDASKQNFTSSSLSVSFSSS